MSQYAYVVVDVEDTGSQATYLTIENPVNSDRIILIEKVIVTDKPQILSADLTSIVGRRADGLAAGTVAALTSYGLFGTFHPEARAVIRTNSPTYTARGNIIQIGISDQSTGAGQMVPIRSEFLSEDNPIILQEGEGFAIFEPGGAARSSLLGITFYWSEKLGLSKNSKIIPAAA